MIPITINNYTTLPNIAVLLQGLVHSDSHVALLQKESEHTLDITLPYLKQIGAIVKIFDNIATFKSESAEFLPDTLLLSAEEFNSESINDSSIIEAEINIIQVYTNESEIEDDRLNNLQPIIMYSVPFRQTSIFYVNHSLQNQEALMKLNNYETIRVE